MKCMRWWSRLGLLSGLAVLVLGVEALPQTLPPPRPQPQSQTQPPASNLLLLRPPRNKGRDVWQERAMELRASATNLARLTATRDYERSRTALTSLANVCNRCHQTFQVQVRLVPFSEPSDRSPETQP